MINKCLGQQLGAGELDRYITKMICDLLLRAKTSKIRLGLGSLFVLAQRTIYIGFQFTMHKHRDFAWLQHFLIHTFSSYTIAFIAFTCAIAGGNDVCMWRLGER